MLLFTVLYNNVKVVVVSTKLLKYCFVSVTVHYHQVHRHCWPVSCKSCRRTFTIYDGESVSPIVYDTWDVDSSEISANLNFEYNDALEVVELDYLLDFAIENMESNDKYKRLKYTPSRRRSSRN